jgi:hypothetical protein
MNDESCEEEKEEQEEKTQRLDDGWTATKFGVAAVLSMGAHALIRHALSRWLPFPAAMSAPRRALAELYIMSTFNAALSGGFAVFKLWPMWHQPFDSASPAGSRSCLAWLYGYFLHDLYATRAQWRTKPADLLHHLLALVTVAMPVFPTGQQRVMTLAAPALLLAELSTIPLNFMWVFRELRRSHTLPARITTVLFVVLFLAIRCVFMPVFLWHIRHRFPTGGWGVQCRGFLLATVGLQLYWGGKIVTGLGRLLISPASPSIAMQAS